MEPNGPARCSRADVDARGVTDADLVERVRRGDDVAFGVLVDRYAEVAFRSALLICRDADEARDAAQEGFIRAHRALGRFRPDAELRPWLLRIVGNAARNRRRGAGRRLGLAMRLVPATMVGASAEDELLVAERRRELLTAIDALREDDRVVITLRWFADLSESEMAAVLDCPRGTVKSRLSRAMERLRGTLAGMDDD